MSPPVYNDIAITPTYLSTDLVTPGRRNRETLPAIGTHTKNINEWKLWGQETKVLSKGELAYHYFKPSHLVTDNVAVTHRHHGNRISYLEATQQPYALTTLLMSKCRLNDQRMPPPFHTQLLQEHFIPEPCPEHLRNSYFSHKCKFQVFPTNGVDLLDTACIPNTRSKKKLLSDNTKKALNEIHSNLYDTVTYQKNFGKTKYDKKENPRVVNFKDAKKIKTEVRCSKPCNCKKSNPCENENKRLLLKRKSMNKYMCSNTKTKNYSWPCWPPGESNITNNPPGYPKIILPKYSFRPKVVKREYQKECICRCEHDEMIAQPSESALHTTHDIEEIQDDNNKDPGADDDVIEADREKENVTPDLNQQLYAFITAKQKPCFNFERGFKTEAHSKYHEQYKDPLPDLRDATTEGRRHHYCGINVHLFRG